MPMTIHSIRLHRGGACLLGIAATLGMLAAQAPATAGTTARAPAPQRVLVCSGTAQSPGSLPGGRYASVLVRGVCAVNAGVVRVRRSVKVTSGSALIAAFGRNDVTGTGRSQLTVGGNVTVGRRAILVLGCYAKKVTAFGHTSAEFPCLDDPSPQAPTLAMHPVVGGSLIASGALGIIAHNATIAGSVIQRGGGGGLTCQPIGLFKLFQSPAYSTYEDSLIGRDFTMTGLRSCWMGTTRNKVLGSMTVAGNKMADPDAMEVVSNVVVRNLSCAANSPKVQFGDSDGRPNQVGGRASGECGFGVILLSPPPSAHIPVKPRRLHISVRLFATPRR
jgi:hypothetical protein